MLHSKVRDAAIITKQFSVFDTRYEPAIRKGEKIDNQEALREEKVIELLETSLSNYLATSDSDNRFYMLNELIAKLAPLYLQRALVAKANSDSNTVANYLSRLSKMLPEGVAASQLDFPPHLWLARYYHLDGDDAKARQTVQNPLQVVIELLFDEEEWNDKYAFKKAHSVVTSLGDDKNALTALAMETRETQFGQVLLCTGGCGQCWDPPSEMWICKHCVNVFLDDNCLTDLKKGQLKKNVCHPDHDFVRVPGWEGGWLDSLPKNMVPWGDQTIALDEWKQEIQKAYFDSNT
ncbi:hypothetical protein N7507_001309 [Penicillium longicatenatum]|nr:hypothetical protein N7507_001309 [Penicillium longicatenatum]